MNLSSCLSAKRRRLEVRARIVRAIRSFFFEHGFLEVQTPVRTPTLAPEEHIDALGSENWYLSTSPELYMKRMLAAGYGLIFQVAPCFRKGEQGTYHLPEFTLLEWYRAYADYHSLESDCEALITSVAREVSYFPVFSYQGQPINLTPPWQRLSVQDAFVNFAGWDPIEDQDSERFQIDLVEKVEPHLDPSSPVFLRDFPAHQASLASLKDRDTRIAERVELFIGGIELANGFTELRDPYEQRMRFEKANAFRSASGKEPYPPSESFLATLEEMPPATGIALGVDRLVMLLTDAATIDEVVAFPPPLI
jgi:lysyl-tRNA synthetase class 2